MKELTILLGNEVGLCLLIVITMMQIETTCEDGSVVFRNGRAVFADVILHCTGYNSFSLPLN